jgi:hypothetical protein
LIWKSEHSDGNIGWAIVAEPGETDFRFVWIRPWHEISMMNTTVPSDEKNPGLCVGFKRTKLSKIERVPNLTGHYLIFRRCCPHYAVYEVWDGEGEVLLLPSAVASLKVMAIPPSEQGIGMEL